MLTKDKTKLLVFENFFVDKDLPKYKKKIEEMKRNRKNSNANTIQRPSYNQYPSPSVIDDMDFDESEDGVLLPSIGIGGGSSGSGFSDDGWITNAGGNIRHKPEDESFWDGIAIETKNELQRQYIANNYNHLMGYTKPKTKNIFQKLLWKWVRRYYVRKFFNNASGSVEQFFVNLTQSAEVLSKVDEKLQSYKNYLKLIKDSGQVALYEKTKHNIYEASREAIMYSIGFTKYLTEEQVISFVLKTQRGLRLDWIKNFTRHIPASVLKKKIKCDEHDIFDNYVVMHYDPQKKSTELTKKEKERKKDPILFGMLKESRNLYFVGDWKDELCDLTFSQIAKKLGESGKITNEYKPEK